MCDWLFKMGFTPDNHLASLNALAEPVNLWPG